MDTEEIMEIVESVDDIVDTGDTDIPGIGTLLAVTTAGSVIAAGLVAGGKWCFNKAKNAIARRKTKKETDKKIEKKTEEKEEVVEATEE